jgi:glycolate oxidase
VIFDADDPASTAAATDAFDDITGIALRLGGTITGEHGVGRLKNDWLRTEQGPVGMSVHHAIKDALDPLHLLCPHGMLAEDGPSSSAGRRPTAETAPGDQTRR